MVTGIEIAGLVLAAIPIGVSAVEHRDVGLKPLNALLFDKKESQDLLDDLEEYALLFRQCCMDMLSVAEVKDKQRYANSKTTAGDLQKIWADPILASTLQMAYGSNYNIILRRLKQVHTHCETLRKYLGEFR